MSEIKEVVAAAPAAIDVTAPQVPKLKFLLLTVAAAAVPQLAFWLKKNGTEKVWIYRASWAGVFLINILTVSIPGRFDSQQGQDVFKLLRTLFEPATWAFAIWGVIYLTELLLTLYVATGCLPASLLQSVLPFWVAGNLFQSLWCFAFRPQFGQVLWLPMSLLALGSVSYALAHRELSMVLNGLDLFGSWAAVKLLLLRFPFALHTGWLAAASLLNFNTWIAASVRSMDTQIAFAFLSTYVAALVGGALTLTSKDPMLACTVAWALAALSVRTGQKITEATPQTSPDTLSALAKTEKGLAFAMLAVGVGSAVVPAIPTMPRSIF